MDEQLEIKDDPIVLNWWSMDPRDPQVVSEIGKNLMGKEDNNMDYYLEKRWIIPWAGKIHNDV